MTVTTPQLSGCQNLINELASIPVDWALTPLLGNKAPYRSKWQHESPLSREDLIAEIQSGKAKGYGIRTGNVSGGIIAIDFDGQSAWELAQRLSNGELPETVSFTSNRPGRHQRLYRIPEEYWEAVKTTKIKTGVKGDDGKPEQLEFRWDGCQSVLPPSAHPETKGYSWINSPDVCEIAIAAMWVIEQMLSKSESEPQPAPPKLRQPAINNNWSAVDWALSYLAGLGFYRADHHDDWIAVGMALHSVSESLLAAWDNWSRQSSKYKPGECQRRWKSFKRQGKGIALGTLGHMAKQDGWKSPFEKHDKPTGQEYGSRRKLGSGSGSSDDGNEPPNSGIAELSLRDRVLEILDRIQDCSERKEAFIKLASAVKVPVNEIKDLAASIETEVDLEETRTERAAKIENLLKISKHELDLADYLHPAIAQPLEKVARWMGSTPAAMLCTLYPVIGSLLPVGTQLELIKATSFSVMPLIYTGIVAESGSNKSASQNTILNPLYDLQEEADKEYEQQLEEYEKKYKEWQKSKDEDKGEPPQKPCPREYFTTDATREAVALILSQQPGKALLGYFDELAGLFKSQGEYKGGRGADGEALLSGRQGGLLKVNRASGKRISVRSTYSITGAIQPDILRKMMGDFTDGNGQWARFLWTVMGISPAPYPDDAIVYDISGLLKGIYRRITQLNPTTYVLNPDAQKLYRNWYNELDRLRLSESRQGLRAVYSKMKGDTGVLALLLHCFNGCVCESSQPSELVSDATMKAAINLAKYHIGQVKLVHSEGDAANGEMADIHAKIIQLSERKGWLKAADVRDIDRQIKKKFTADDIRNQFRELVASGFGQTQGKGSKLQWTIHTTNPTDPKSRQTQDNSGQTQDTTLESLLVTQTIGNTSFEQLEQKIHDNTQGNSGQTQDSLLMAESILESGVQPLENKTQDTQDTFSLLDEKESEPVGETFSENELKSDDLSFAVLSCPECPELGYNTEQVDISAQDKTQDTCPEIVLSCPECPASPQTKNEWRYVPYKSSKVMAKVYGHRPGQVQVKISGEPKLIWIDESLTRLADYTGD